MIQYRKNRKGRRDSTKTIRNAAALFLSLLLLTMLCGAEEKKTGFADVPAGHWAEDSILGCAQRGILQGVGGDSFGMGQEMSRAAYLTALCRVLGWEMQKPEQGSFADNQNPGKWYFSAVETAKAHGVLSGLGENCRPEEGITREEMAAITVRALGCSVLGGVLAEKCPFSDCTSNSGFITLACRMGIVTGVNRFTFSPKAKAMREQAAAVLLRTDDALHRTVQIHDREDTEAVTVVESITDRSGGIPLSPRIPPENIYASAQAGATALALNAAPVAQKVSPDGTVGEATAISQGWLSALLADGGTVVHHSLRYAGSYLLHPESDGSTTVVWYESENDLAEKVALCRLLGIKEIYIIRE